MIYIDMYNGTHDEFPCQVCWKRYAVPIQGLQAFEQDYQVKVLQETMAQMSMGQGHRDPDRGQTGPFGYTPQPQMIDNNTGVGNIMEPSTQIREDISDYMQQPYNLAAEASQCVASEPAAPRDQSPPPGTDFPSMVSHMVPQPLTSTHQESNRRTAPQPGYCMRSAHMYMHMV